MRTLSDRRIRRLTVPIVAVLAPLAIALVVLPWRDDLPGSAAALLMVTVVVAVAARGDRGAGVLASISAAAWFDLLLVRPYESFAITSREDVETTALLLVVGVTVTEIAVRGRRHRSHADLAAHQLRTISRLADLAATDTGDRTTVAATRTALAEVLGGAEVQFERSRLGGMPRLHADGRIGGDDDVVWPVEQVGLPPMPFEIVAERGGVGYGRFVVHAHPAAHADRSALLVAKVVADLAATALAREHRRHGPSRV
ncbi:DUF4118 domain-containing protein [Jatrophihabitans sp. YIM 134969]